MCDVRWLLLQGKGRRRRRYSLGGGALLVASKVTVSHRRDMLRAERILQERALRNPEIAFLWNKQVLDVRGDDEVTGVRIRDLKTREESNVECSGVFVAIGHKPNTEIFARQVEIDQRGYVVRKLESGSMSSVEGVFLAGDVHDYVCRQAVTAAASG